MFLRIAVYFTLLVSCFSAGASEVFNYGWTTQDGYLISGTVKGERIANFVVGLSDVTILVDGHKVEGPIFQSHVDLDYSNVANGGAYMAFDHMQNNFHFSDSEYGTPPPTFSFFDYTAFYTQQYPGMGYTWVNAFAGDVSYGAGIRDWYLQAEVANVVSEPSSAWLLLLALGALTATRLNGLHARFRSSHRLTN